MEENKLPKMTTCWS